MDRQSAFFMNGGAGRHISSIPALELYAKENPDDDFIIASVIKWLTRSIMFELFFDSSSICLG